MEQEAAAIEHDSGHARLLGGLGDLLADFGSSRCEAEISRAQAQTLARYLRAMLPPDTVLDVLRRLETADCRSTVYLNGPQALAMGLGWASVARGGMTLHDLPGTHLSILHPGNVEVLADHLRRLIEGGGQGARDPA